MLTPSRRTLSPTAPTRRLPLMVYQMLLVPEMLATLPLLLAHQLLGGPAWAALLVLGLLLFCGLRIALLYGARRQLQLGRYQQAAQLLELALRMYPRSADGQSLRASVALAQGDVQQAELALRRAIAYLPEQAALLAALSGVLVDQERLHEARHAAAQALAYDPHNAAALLHLAGIERCLQAPHATVQELIERGLAGAGKPGDEAALRCVLAEVLADQGQAARALLELRRVETLLAACSVSQQAALHCHVGALLRQLEQPDPALRHFQAAEALDPLGRYAQLAWRAARSS